jgi:hypothetical protein
MQDPSYNHKLPQTIHDSLGNSSDRPVLKTGLRNCTPLPTLHPEVGIFLLSSTGYDQESNLALTDSQFVMVLTIRPTKPVTIFEHTKVT